MLTLTTSKILIRFMWKDTVLNVDGLPAPWPGLQAVLFDTDVFSAQSEVFSSVRTFEGEKEPKQTFSRSQIDAERIFVSHFLKITKLT